MHTLLSYTPKKLKILMHILKNQKHEIQMFTDIEDMIRITYYIVSVMNYCAAAIYIYYYMDY